MQLLELICCVASIASYNILSIIIILMLHEKQSQFTVNFAGMLPPSTSTCRFADNACITCSTSFTQT